VRGDGSRIAEHNVEHARRQTGVHQRAGERQARRRGLLGGLEHHGASSSQCTPDLACRNSNREIPRSESCDRTDRLAQHHIPHARITCRHDPAVDPPTLLGEPVDDVGGGEHLDRRFCNWLALLQSGSGADFLRAFA